MTFLRSLHFKVLITCVLVFIVAIIGIRINFYYLGMIGILALFIFPITLILAGRRFAPSPFNNFATWIVIVMIGICTLNWIGQDDKGFALTFFTLDYVFMKLLYHDTVREYMIDSNGFTLFSYIVRIVLGFLYGITLDAFIYLVKKIKRSIFLKFD